MVQARIWRMTRPVCCIKTNITKETSLESRAEVVAYCLNLVAEESHRAGLIRGGPFVVGLRTLVRVRMRIRRKKKSRENVLAENQRRIRARAKGERSSMRPSCGEAEKEKESGGRFCAVAEYKQGRTNERTRVGEIVGQVRCRGRQQELKRARLTDVVVSMRLKKR